MQYDITDETGKFSFYTEMIEGIRIQFQDIDINENGQFAELGQIKELLISKNVKAWRLFTILPVGRAAFNPDLLLSDSQFLELMDFISDQRKRKELDVKFSCEGYTGRYEKSVRDSYFFCRAGINIGSILIDGAISACPNIDRSFSQGNIYKDNFNDVWQNSFIPFRNREWTKTGQCETCRHFKDCQGNGFHNWHGDRKNVLVCHHGKIENALRNRHPE